MKANFSTNDLIHIKVVSRLSDLLLQKRASSIPLPIVLSRYAWKAFTPEPNILPDESKDRVLHQLSVQ
jgi:hypothetical protein